MIPRTFPSVLEGNTRKMVVYILPSVVGLQAWKDYIPVKGISVTNTAVENTYANDGYQVVKTLGSTTGTQAWVDYIPVYEDATLTKPWSTDIGGYIPASGLSSLNLDFTLGRLDPRITFSRTSNATLTGSNGLVQYAPHNLLTYSEQVDNSAWTKTNATVTANVVVAPDGTTTADKFVESSDAVATTHTVSAATFDATTGLTYTFSFYAKAAERSVLVIYDGAWSGNEMASFNLSSGTANILASFGNNSAAITSVGNGWYRCVYTETTTSTLPTTRGFNRIRLSNGTTTSYVGNGTSGAYIWGAQLEIGSTATTYNPTTVKNLLGYTQEFDNAAWNKTNSFVQTNLLTYSQEFDNSAWSKSNSTISANSFASPDGTVTADKLVENTVNSDHRINGTISVTVGLTYTTSLYLKAGERTQVVLYSNLQGGTKKARIDLSNGTVVSSTMPSAPLVTSVGNGWYRVAYTQTADIASAISIYVVLVNDSGQEAYTGDGTSGIFIWGAQLVQGSTAGDYQVTTAAAAAVQYVGPFGYLGAEKLVEGTTNTAHRILNSSAVVVSTVDPSAYTVYAKAAERTSMRLTDNDLQGADFDLLTGVVSNISAGTVATATSIGNGWWRLFISRTSGTANGRIVVSLLNSGASTYTGNGTSGIYIFGAQLSDSASLDPYVYNPVAAPAAAAYYGPRFDYDPITKAPKGLLIEEQRTNLVLNSSILNTQIVTVTAAAHTLSFYGTGTIVLSGAYTGTLVGTGDYPTRTTLTFTPIAGALTLTVTGSVTMAQLEAGSFATSYIPTVASQVTRAADNVSMLGSNFSQWYNQNVGTLFGQFDCFGFTAGSTRIFGVSDGTTSNRIRAFINASTLLRSTVVTGGVEQAVLDSAINSVTSGTHKLSIAYAANDFAQSADAGAIASDTSGTVPAVNLFAIGQFEGLGGNYLNGHVQRIAYYNRRLSNSELQSITA